MKIILIMHSWWVIYKKEGSIYKNNFDYALVKNSTIYNWKIKEIDRECTQGTLERKLE